MPSIQQLLPLFLYSLLCSGTLSAQAKLQIPLQQNWTFSELDSAHWRPAQVPGVVHSDLLRLGLIPDPWFGNHEKQLQWIEEKNWQYQTRFKLSKQQLKNKHIELVFKGLDTYATVYVNGQQVLEADNMFRSWRVDVKPFLRKDSNELKIVFRNPVEVNKPKLQALGYELPAGSETGPFKVSPFTRKAPYHFGWDWGPRYLTCGIWRPVLLELWQDAKIEDIEIIQKTLTEEQAVLTIKTKISTKSKKSFDLRINEQIYHIQTVGEDSLYAFDYQILKPKRWWPNGWGEAYLYPIQVELVQQGKVLDQCSKKIGLRSVELVRAADSIGHSFYFKVNGEKLFAKGANYIPQSHFLPSVRPEQYQQLIADTKAVNMNMLRVWGGGIYEADLFYDLCDENGILVWQDFMFAGSMYPGDSAFLANVAAEVRENVCRLRHHPCLALWNGNNEMEVAWFNWGWQRSLGYSPQDSAKIWQDYQKIFHVLIPQQLQILDPTRAYTSTSPLSNWGKAENFNHHSMHYWGVWHGQDAFEDYSKNVGRFMSEYGFQSFPNMETIRQFADSSDWNLESEVMKGHQKSYVGNGMILKQLQKYFPAPVDFADFVAKSQATQALAMQMAIDAHRLRKGHCWGSLYWQLNDCWPGPSWSSRDVYGRWKQLHHQLANLFASPALIPQLDGDLLSLHLVNDGLEKLDLQLQLYWQTEAGSAFETEEISLHAEANSLSQVYRKNLSALRAQYPNLKLSFALLQGKKLLFERALTLWQVQK